MMSLRVRCSNKANGCDWVRELQIWNNTHVIVAMHKSHVPMNVQNSVQTTLHHISHWCSRKIWRSISTTSVKDAPFSVLTATKEESIRKLQQSILTAVWRQNFNVPMNCVNKLFYEKNLLVIKECASTS